jgi:uncharacterized membrane protein
MAKFLLILFIGLTFESTGIVFLKKGMMRMQEAKSLTFGEVCRVIKAGAMNRDIVLGIFFQALFFACLLMLMSKNDISFLWPLTALSFVFATLASIWFLHEHVSPARWAGVAFIMIGAALITYSEHSKPKPGAEPVTTSAELSK